jgi:hypothetical protein
MVAAGSWTNVSGATRAYLFTGPLTQTTCYRVRINTNCGMATSEEACVIVVELQPNPVIDGPIVVCRGQQVIYQLEGNAASSTIVWNVTGNDNSTALLFPPYDGAVVVRWGNTQGTYTLTATQTLGENCTATVPLFS